MERRMRWLVHPAVALALFVLVVNDHVLKERATHDVAALATGKLSDVAGVALLALLLGGLSGRTAPSLTLVGGAFVALKVVPGVAEAAAPVLGGTTRRDATDLVALLVLVPVALVLRRTDAPPTPSRVGWAGRLAASVGAALPVAVAGTSVIAVTATQCDVPPAVVEVRSQDDRLYAGVGRFGPTQWWVSDDGVTWDETDVEPAEPTTTSGPRPPASEPSEDACTDDGTCYRTAGGRRGQVERSSAAGAWEEEFRFTPAQYEEMDEADPCAPQGRLTSVATAGDEVVVSLGQEGVLRRDPGSGEWRRVPVGGIEPTRIDGRDDGIAGGPGGGFSGWLLLAPVAAVIGGAAMAVVARRRAGGYRSVGVLMVALVGAVGAFVVAGAGAIIGSEATGGVALVVTSLLVLLVAVGLALLPDRRRPLPPWPPTDQPWDGRPGPPPASPWG